MPIPEWTTYYSGLAALTDKGSRVERGLLLDLAVEFDEFTGEVEQAHDVVARKPIDPQQMAAAENERRLVGDVH